METEEKITYADILRVLASIKAAGQFEQIYLKFGDIEIDLSRGPGQSAHPSTHSPRRRIRRRRRLRPLQPPVAGREPKPAPIKPRRMPRPCRRPAC